MGIAPLVIEKMLRIERHARHDQNSSCRDSYCDTFHSRTPIIETVIMSSGVTTNVWCHVYPGGDEPSVGDPSEIANEKVRFRASSGILKLSVENIPELFVCYPAVRISSIHRKGGVSVCNGQLLLSFFR